MKKTLQFRANLKRWRNPWWAVVFIVAAGFLVGSGLWLVSVSPTPIDAISDEDGIAYTQAIAARAVAFFLSVLSGGLISAYLIYSLRLGLVGVVMELDERLSEVEKGRLNEN